MTEPVGRAAPILVAAVVAAIVFLVIAIAIAATTPAGAQTAAVSSAVAGFGQVPVAAEHRLLHLAHPGASRRPAAAIRSIHGSSRPSVVSCPWPGSTRVSDGMSRASRASEETICTSLPPGRSVRPYEPANRTSSR
jgi:hypothetical protein